MYSELDRIEYQRQRRSTVKKEVIQRQMSLLTEELIRLESLRTEPDNEPAIIYFEKQFSPGGRKYTYCCVKANGFWYTSGPKGGGRPNTWEDLIEWIGEETDVWVVTEMAHLTEGK